jgi:hypothetical protein
MRIRIKPVTYKGKVRIRIIGVSMKTAPIIKSKKPEKPIIFFIFL